MYFLFIQKSDAMLYAPSVGEIKVSHRTTLIFTVWESRTLFMFVP